MDSVGSINNNFSLSRAKNNLGDVMGITDFETVKGIVCGVEGFDPERYYKPENFEDPEKDEEEYQRNLEIDRGVDLERNK